MSIPALEKIIEKLDKQLATAQRKVSDIRAHIEALKRFNHQQK